MLWPGQISYPERMYRLEICVYEVYVSQRADARGLGARSPVDVCKLDLRLDESEMSDGVW